MKNIIFAIILFLLPILSYAQLNDSAELLKTSTPDIYQKGVRFAAQNWEGDHEMMVYTINEWAEAFVEVYRITQAPGYDERIMEILADKWALPAIDSFDYGMILYEYQNQIKAKNSY